MATKPKPEAETPGARIPQPVSGGTAFHESLGRWFDNLFGDRRQREATVRELAPFLADDKPEDPPPSEPPPPVPGGTQPLTRGAKPKR